MIVNEFIDQGQSQNVILIVHKFPLFHNYPNEMQILWFDCAKKFIEKYNVLYVAKINNDRVEFQKF